MHRKSLFTVAVLIGDDPGFLAQQVSQTLQSFVEGPRDGTEKWQRRFPSLVFITGDVTQRGRPKEFELASEFMRHLAKLVAQHRQDHDGLLRETKNIVLHSLYSLPPRRFGRRPGPGGAHWRHAQIP